MNRNLQSFETVAPPPISVQGRPRKITLEAEEGIARYLEEDPTAYQDEIQEFLLDEYGIEVSRQTVGRVMKKKKLTHKRVERIRPEQDQELRSLWVSKLVEYSAEQLIFVDESGANERTADRKYGWSLRGIPCRAKSSGKRSSRWSILPAIGINGYLDWEVYHGSYNAERFNNFIRHLLTKMEPFPGPRSVLVMDNVNTHHSPELKGMCDEAGVRLEYLPPYSPDYNPIEKSFSALKAWIRRNRALAAEFEEDEFEVFLTIAIRECSIKLHARGYFRSAMVEVTDFHNDVDYHTLDGEI
jgi:transposase